MNIALFMAKTAAVTAYRQRHYSNDSRLMNVPSMHVLIAGYFNQTEKFLPDQSQLTMLK